MEPGSDVPHVASYQGLTGLCCCGNDNRDERERGRGFEPLLQPWKGRVLPLHQPRGTAGSIAVWGSNGAGNTRALMHQSAHQPPRSVAASACPASVTLT